MANSGTPESASQTWQELGLIDPLCEACAKLNWKKPSKIQAEAIPLALQGRDIIGLAETGSGKTAAFVLPIVQALFKNTHHFFAVILTPTRELALQIAEEIDALAGDLGVRTAAIIGGFSMKHQVQLLAKKPHIIVATPGRLNDHLTNTKGFHLKWVKYLVMDEADRILDMDFQREVDAIVDEIKTKERRTYLFSATMTTKVKELQRAHLNDPVKIEVNEVYKTVESLKQYYVNPPEIYKDVWLYHLLKEMSGINILVFTNTVHNAVRLRLMLKKLGIFPIAVHGKMDQKKRYQAVAKYQAKNRSVLIATDVASRGLDIPHINVVLNYDMPKTVESYIHRVGRTARAGRAGIAITFVTQHNVGRFQWLEKEMGGDKLPAYEMSWPTVVAAKDKVLDAAKEAEEGVKDMEKEIRKGLKRKRKEGDDDGEKKKNKAPRERNLFLKPKAKRKH